MIVLTQFLLVCASSVHECIQAGSGKRLAENISVMYLWENYCIGCRQTLRHSLSGPPHLKLVDSTAILVSSIVGHQTVSCVIDKPGCCYGEIVYRNN
jgi:hypothetical protein